MLNDRIDEGLAVIQSHRDYASAMDFFLPRLQFKEVMAMEGKIDAHTKPADAMHIRACGRFGHGGSSATTKRP